MLQARPARLRPAQAARRADGDRDRARRRADGRAPTSSPTRSTTRSRRSSRRANKGHAWSSHRPKRSAAKSRAETSPVTAAMVEQVGRTPGVAQAAGAIFSRGHVPRHAPQTAHERLRARVHRLDACRPASSPSSRSRAASRRAPREVAIDQATAERSGPAARPADARRGRAPTGTYTIVGILKFGGRRILRRRRRRAADCPPRRSGCSGEPGRFDQIDVAAAPGRLPGERCATGSAPSCPAPSQVRTGAEQAANQTPATSKTTSASCGRSC